MGSNYKRTPLTLWSNNVRGLNIPEKRSQLLRTLWAERASVAFLQETHFQGAEAPTVRNGRYPTGFYANHPDVKKAQVAILLSSTVPFICTEQKSDPGGRYIFIKGTIAQTTYTFACLYSPNRRQHVFLTKTLALLNKFRDGLLIVAGDLNTPLDSRLDTSRGETSMPGHCIRSTGRALAQCGLADCWRVANPEGRNYTFYSAVHQRYNQIDYILMAQEALTLLQRANIGLIADSDHTPITVQIQSPPT
ncbi:Hypothetical predicted protein [Pelobates cultripes]|uniref:exodeoxyribonuclease III n=1 Tax=Pelobates cultripes TaxID=61616 RepID=A0AAD1S2N2_PELCU|nr:Hypothetical predicted protein [Pelobates cultripes]